MAPPSRSCLGRADANPLDHVRHTRSVTLPFRRLMPGVVLCLLVAGLTVVVNQSVPTLSPLLLAIIVGAVVSNTVRLPERFAAGVTFSSKHLLRAGIVLLGLQLVLGDIVALGWPTVIGVIGVVTASILITLAAAKALGVPPRLGALIACGFSICGAAAVAGVKDTIDADEDEAATAIALVVVFGTVMILIAPLAAHAMGLGVTSGGKWVGSSVHEVAQVVAAGSALGPGALKVAVIVKLARVALLAPVAVAFSLAARRSGTAKPDAKRPPIIPLFVVAFLVMVVVASLHLVPAPIAADVKVVQTTLLAAAMFGLGLGVNIKTLRAVGGRPVILGLVSTVSISALALVMVAASGTWGS